MNFCAASASSGSTPKHVVLQPQLELFTSLIESYQPSVHRHHCPGLFEVRHPLSSPYPFCFWSSSCLLWPFPDGDINRPVLAISPDHRPFCSRSSSDSISPNHMRRYKSTSLAPDLVGDCAVTIPHFGARYRDHSVKRPPVNHVCRGSTLPTPARWAHWAMGLPAIITCAPSYLDVGTVDGLTPQPGQPVARKMTTFCRPDFHVGRIVQARRDLLPT